MKVIEAKVLADRIRARVLNTAFAANKGHIGSALSIVDIVASLAVRMRGLGSREPHRDRFALSKGHAALAWYAALLEFGIIDEATLASYGRDGTLLGTHPDPALPGVDFMTGSLGQGLSFGVGSAMAAKRSKAPWATYVLLSDSELNEGVTWESALIAAHHRCGGLTMVLDANGQQALGFTKDVLDTSAAPTMFGAMGWRVSDIDGHDVTALGEALGPPDAQGDGRPHLVFARTTAGKGVDFMERRIEWHYLPMTPEQHSSAMAQVKAETDA